MPEPRTEFFEAGAILKRAPPDLGNWFDAVVGPGDRTGHGADRVPVALGRQRVVDGDGKGVTAKKGIDYSGHRIERFNRVAKLSHGLVHRRPAVKQATHGPELLMVYALRHALGQSTDNGVGIERARL